MALRPQLQQPNLGARMEHAMRHAFAAGHRSVVIVGTDIPDLTAGLVARALQALRGHQVGLACPAVLVPVSASNRCQPCCPAPHNLQAVFGPAEDGGYYLLALSSLPQELFEVGSSRD